MPAEQAPASAAVEDLVATGPGAARGEEPGSEEPGPVALASTDPASGDLTGANSAVADLGDADSAGEESDMRVTQTGLGIEDLKVGAGPVAQEGDRVTVHYVGRRESGKVFEDSRKHGRPFEFEVGRGRVIAGWDEGLVGMQVGGVRRLTIPSKLGYGERGAMPGIPPNALLEFEIELLAID